MNITVNKDNELQSKQLCEQFMHSNNYPRYILGRNKYAESVAQFIDVDGFIDEYSKEEIFLQKPVIIDLALLPKNAIVLSCNVHGRPITVRNRLNQHSITNIDYFAFLKYSGLAIIPIEYWNNFEQLFKKNKDSYTTIYHSLADEESKRTFEKIINFRLSFDLTNMDGFTNCEY